MIVQGFLWVLLALFVLLLLALALPMAVYVDYTNREFTLKVRVLFVKLKAWPLKPPSPEKEQRRKEKQAKKQARKKKKSPQGEAPQKKERRTLGQNIAFVQRLVASLTPAAKLVCRHLHVRDVALVLPVHGEDAGETALDFGRMQGLVFGTYATLQNVFPITCRQLVLIPDFMDEHRDKLTFSCKIVAFPVIMLLAAGMALKQYLTYNRAKRQNYRLAGQQMLEEKRARARRKKPMEPPPAFGGANPEEK